MTSNNPRSLARVILNVWVALAMTLALAASVSPAFAANPPANDTFVNAKKITTASLSVGISDMTGATEDFDDPFLTCDGGGTGEATLWYTYTPVNSGEMTLGTTNSGYDTIITVFMAENPSDPSYLVEVGCNDDVTATITTSSMVLPVRGGVKYYIQIARKTGTVTSPPDNMRFTFAYSNKPVLLPPVLYDGSEDEIIYSPVGWLLYPVLPGITYKSNVHVGNNPGDSATIYFDGSGVRFCYVVGPDMGNLNIFIDGVYVGMIGQGSGLYQYTCWDSPNPPIPDSVSLASDNLHKMVLQHAGPAGKKVNIDTFEVYYHWDFIPPGVIDDPHGALTATTGTSSGKVVLTWLATGDDDYIGRVFKNEIRYSLDPIVDEASWDAATPYVVNLPAVLTSGSKQTVTISGLVPGLTYHFNVRGVDEVGNKGPVSNDASAIAKAGTPVGSGTYDDATTNWVYTGTWSVVNSPDNIGDTLHVANQLGSTANFYFTGTQFRLFYNSGFDMGLLDVILDGVYLTTIDQYTLGTLRRTFVSPILTYGPHSVQFVQKSLPYVNVDAIAIFKITDGGEPDPITDLVATPSLITPGAVDLEWTAMGDDPGSIGKAAKYEVRYSLNPILTELDWNSALPVPGAVPAPHTAGWTETMTVTNLTPGVEYWFAVRVNDDAGYFNFSNSDDAIASTVGLSYWGAGWYEDNDFAWLYNGPWTSGSSGYASGGSQHATNYAGSTATFLFTGTGFDLYYQMKSGYTSLKVYIDGVLVGSINQKNNVTLWQQMWSYTGLPAGNHTVQFVAAGPSTVDAIEILP